MAPSPPAWITQWRLREALVPPTCIPTQSTVADINGDGKNDIVVTQYYGANVTILTGNGDNTMNMPDVGYATGGD